MVRTVGPREDEPIEPAPQSYVVDRDNRGVPISTQLVRLFQGVLLIIIAGVSLALFWVVGLSLGIL